MVIERGSFGKKIHGVKERKGPGPEVLEVGFFPCF